MKIVKGDYTEMECDLLVVPVPAGVHPNSNPPIPQNNLVGASTSNYLFSKLPAAALIWGSKLEKYGIQGYPPVSQLISTGGYLITPPLSGGTVNKAPYDVFVFIISGYGYNLGSELKRLVDCVEQNSFNSIVIPRYYDSNQVWDPIYITMQATLKDDKYILAIP